jgi:hypothetical protein
MNGMRPYFARVLDDIQYSPGGWHGLRVGVFRRENGTDVQVGEYERNYPSLLHTFAPFRADGRDLTLYSPDYTCSRRATDTRNGSRTTTRVRRGPHRPLIRFRGGVHLGRR